MKTNIDSCIKVKRSPQRGIYDFEKITQILDADFHCSVSFIDNDYPVNIPTIYGRKGDRIFIHGSVVSRMIKELEKEINLCLNVTIVDGLVLAKSAYHHSLNYRSVVIFGKATLVGEDEKLEALKCISEHMIPGRWEEVRQPSKKELKVTSVLEIPLNKFSAKVREGNVKEEIEDLELNVWSGIVPLKRKALTPVPDSSNQKSLTNPISIVNFINKHQ